MEADKKDRSKPKLGLVPSSLIWAVAEVLSHAVHIGKYKAHNWRRGQSWTEAYSALQRHLTDWNEGRERDADSGLPTLWHAACDLAFLIEYEKKGVGTDDRYKPGQD